MRRNGGRDVAQRAVEGRPRTQEAAALLLTDGVVGAEERLLETLRRVDLGGLLAFGIGIGAQHLLHGVGQQAGRAQLLGQLFGREVAQPFADRASGVQRRKVLAVVVGVEQPHLTGIGPAHPLEYLGDDGPGVEPLGVGFERILPKSGHQAVIVATEHARYALKSISETFSRRYSPSSASTSASENEM